jgi:hypothetical protein
VLLAHEFAPLAKLTANCAAWRHSVPSCVSELLKLDCNPISD